MDEPQNKAELLEWVVDGRATLVHLVSQIPRQHMLAPGVEADWSIKDILAHITSWELKMCEVFAEVQAGQAPSNWPATNEAVDALNAEFTRANKDKPLDQVLQEFETSYPQALAAVEAMPEAVLFDPDRFTWRQGRPLWWLVAGNMFGHYGEHIPALEAWLAQNH